MAGEGSQTSRIFLLDTGIIIRYLRGNEQAADLLDYLEKMGEINVSVITYIEILIRCHPHEEESTRLFFERVPSLIISQEVAEKTASLISKYQTVFGKDNPRQYPDALIAATAWQQQGILVTLNKKHFATTTIDECTIQIINQDAKDWVSQLKL